MVDFSCLRFPSRGVCVNRCCFLFPVVAVLCEETVHEQKPVCSRTVKLKLAQSYPQQVDGLQNRVLFCQDFIQFEFKFMSSLLWMWIILSWYLIK